MAEKVKVVVFKHEAEAYKLFSDIKNGLIEKKNYDLSEMMIIRKTGNSISIRESFDTGTETANDTSKGMLIGAFIGVLGGPMGVLLGGSTGAFAGSLVDAGDAGENLTVIEKVSSVITDGETAVIALVSESVENSFDSEFNGVDVDIYSESAAEVMAEVEEAKRVEKELKKEARKRMAEEKKEDVKHKLEDYTAQLKAKFAKKGN
ncbi:MAG: DUF1269 domain-containing protein [Sphaerochaetaceae bacterium]|nr:DUF1269 domain-containing protein [Sphaerochaetaceae bacterium]